MANKTYVGQDLNFYVTKLVKDTDGCIKELEINKKPVALEKDPKEVVLYAWKHSSDYIYTYELPTEAGSVDVVVYPLDDATGTYVPAADPDPESITYDSDSYTRDDTADYTVGE